MMMTRNIILPLVLSLSLGTAFVSSPAFSAEDDLSEAVQKKVLAEYQILSAKPKAQIREHENGVSISVSSEYSVTFFAARGEPAYPAYVKRQLKQEKDKVVQVMTVVCGKTKSICDGFVDAYLEKTKRLQEAAKRKQGLK